MAGFRPKGDISDRVNETDLTASLIIKNVARMFYIMDPAEGSFKELEDLPSSGYVQQSMPYFFGMILLEWIVLLLKGKMPRFNDGIMSVSHGLLMTFVEFFTSGFLFAGYMYIYNNYAIYVLPWDSLSTWILAGLGIDFCYYWVHRAAHEINLLWAAHQVHHSSEEYNLTTALRQSIFQSFGAWPFYLPMAFFIPPQHAIIHKELNLLYQFWIHTEIVDNLGPLEYILNTSSHHRVHHGANRYCLDKNYAGVLIIWDRLFGTFEQERDDIKIVYGLVDQPQFFNPVKNQLFYYGKVLEKARSMDNWTDYIFAFIKGPGWFPGTERLGDITFVDERPVREKYNPPSSTALHLYTLAHFTMSVIASDILARNLAGMSQSSSLLVILYLMWTLTSIGLLYDHSKWAWLGELTRCSVSLAYMEFLAPLLLFSTPALKALYAGSAVISTGNLLVQTLAGKSKTKAE